MFKKKSVKGKRRARPDLDFEEPESISTFGAVKKPEVSSSNGLKWARYASLHDPEHVASNELPSHVRETIDKVNLIATPFEDEEDTPQIADLDSRQSQTKESLDRHLGGQNIAYKSITSENIKEVLQSASRASDNTFTLKQLYFRDTPMETVSLEAEYADTYGNVSDEDFNRAKNLMQPEQAEEDDAEMLDDYSKPTLSTHHDFYDLEVSVNSDDMDEDSSKKIPSSEEVRESILSRIERLEISLKLSTSRADTLELKLKESQTKRLELFKRLQTLD